MASQLDKDKQANLNNQRVDDTFSRLVQINDKRILDGNGNPIEPEFGGNVHISGSLTVSSVEYDTVSYISSSGDSKFGDSSDDTHEFTGSVLVTGDIIPNTANAQHIGSLEKPWKDLYLASSSLHIVSGTADSAQISFLDDRIVIDKEVSSSFKGVFSGDGSGLVNTQGVFVTKSEADYPFEEGLYYTNNNIQVSGTMDIKDGLLVDGIPLGSNPDSFWLLGGDNSIRYNQGNIGVGITNPQSKLVVGGDTGVLLDIDSSDQSSIFQISSTGTTYSQVGLGVFSGLPNYSLGIKSHNNTYIGSGSTPSIVIEPDGKVGIGNLTPSYELDVSGDINANTIYSNTKKVLVSSDTGSMGNLTVAGNIDASGDMVIQGSLTAEKYIVSSSVTNLVTQDVSGSSIFGNSSDDTHQFTGSLSIIGDITSSGDIISTTGKFTNVVVGGTDISSNVFREWKQECKLVDSTFINAPTFSLDFYPVTDSEDVYMNGLRMTKGVTYDYHISSESTKDMIFNEEIIFRPGDVITIKYSTIS